ncbi:hypothetical protein KSC_003060 [Ktedonobacter sp. SOSP1-52]|uniref:hypothetical protein n=1 Tax=Ktedonobacter sp. SOSP1-52 TaxID=2778366 RepID=UPI00191649B0|nr:hypothetical protein [Ktedonobacter sp. SOSP1-52]GHO61414.1 hypothetical protein KSC_003060 [Ktedonobacter sp. SOSP1-52]
MGNSSRDKKPSLAALRYTAYRRQQQRLLKWARALAGQIPDTDLKSCNIEDVAFDIASEVADADLVFLLHERPDWIVQPSTDLYASDVFSGVSIKDLLLRHLTKHLIESLQERNRPVE